MESKNIRFEGNCYSPEWEEEAKKRGLPIAHSTQEALALFLVPENRELLSRMGIFTEREIEGYYETRLEQYVKTLDIEMNVMESMVRNGILPAISSHITSEGTALSYVPERAREGSSSRWLDHIEELYRIKEGLLDGAARLASLRNSLSSLDLEERASDLTEKGIPIMDGIRGMCDAAEVLVGSGLWPYPTYCDILMGK